MTEYQNESYSIVSHERMTILSCEGDNEEQHTSPIDMMSISSEDEQNICFTGSYC